MTTFLNDLKYHEGFLLRQLPPLERENEELRVKGVSFKDRLPAREAIAAVEKTLSQVRVMMKKEHGQLY